MAAWSAGWMDAAKVGWLAVHSVASLAGLKADRTALRWVEQLAASLVGWKARMLVACSAE
jgi:hypothetical protein